MPEIVNPDAHKGKRAATYKGKEKRAYKPKQFSGIDGESYNIDGIHTYVLLMDSSGKHLYDPNGLSTKRCFDFLLDLPKSRIYVAFGLNYDVNMMLRDLGHRKLRELWVTTWTLWFNYRLEWIPGKWFEIQDTFTGRKIKINETFGFFQTSFVKSLAKWNIDVQDQQELEDMKASRSVFDADMVERMIEYCRTECQLLNSLMTQLRNALTDCGIHPSSWNGAGSIASAIFKVEGVKQHLVRPDNSQVVEAIMRAYYGGRTEVFKQGVFRTCHQFDVVSAYPYAATFLPTNGTWKNAKVYDDSKWAIWEVTWDNGGGLGPFPYRRKQSISYPVNGQGWYHTIEVQAAIDSGADVLIRQGWILEPDTNVKPFQFVERYAAQKVAYKKQGHAGEKVIKLGINSLYGKLAQGLGYGDDVPPYQCYFWAGYITAHCRATMLRLASQYPERVVMIATDGIFLDGDGVPEYPVREGLGGLEYNLLKNCFVAQPGVYHAYTPDGQEIRKSRGMFAREIDFDSLRTGWDLMGPNYIGRYPTERFQGLGTSLSRKDMSQWRTWPKAERSMRLMPSTKTLGDPDSNGIYPHYPPRLDTTELSAAYTPKQRGHLEDEQELRSAKDQPLREL